MRRYFWRCTLKANIGKFRLQDKIGIELPLHPIMVHSVLHAFPPNLVIHKRCFSKQWTFNWLKSSRAFVLSFYCILLYFCVCQTNTLIMLNIYWWNYTTLAWPWTGKPWTINKSYQFCWSCHSHWAPQSINTNKLTPHTEWNTQLHWQTYNRFKGCVTSLVHFVPDVTRIAAQMDKNLRERQLQTFGGLPNKKIPILKTLKARFVKLLVGSFTFATHLYSRYRRWR